MLCLNVSHFFFFLKWGGSWPKNRKLGEEGGRNILERKSFPLETNILIYKKPISIWLYVLIMPRRVSEWIYNL